LIDGNARFVAGRLEHPNLSAERRSETRQGQKPFAIILGCSDSRVPADLVFDTGLGDLFVVRVAGNVTDDVVIGSIEYAVEHLGSRLILVLGHEKCGAVAAAMAAAETDEHLPGHIDSLVEAIDPALREMPASTRDRLDDAVRANVRYVTDQLRHAHPILSHAVKSGELQIVGAYYDLESGRVEVIDPSR
jgi:carbonic anhydrase